MLTKQAYLLRTMMFSQQQPQSMLMLSAMRSFATPTKKIGINDALQDAKQEAKKYGIKRRFYDHLPTIARQLPEGL